MNHKHTTTCEHEIKVCDCCDSAYCTKCEKEWGAQKPCTLNHWPTYIPYYPQPVLQPRPLWYYQPYYSQQPYVGAMGSNITVPYANTTMMQISSTGTNTQ